MDSFRITESTPVRSGPEMQGTAVSAGMNVEHLRDGKKSVKSGEGKQKRLEENTEPAVLNQQDAEEIKKTADKINKSLRLLNTKIQVDFDNDTGKMVIHLVDTESGDVVRQIPSDSMLKLSARIADYIGEWPEKDILSEGAVIDKKV